MLGGQDTDDVDRSLPQGPSLIEVVLGVLELGHAAHHPGQLTPARGGVWLGSNFRLELALGSLQILPRFGPSVFHRRKELSQARRGILRQVVLKAGVARVASDQLFKAVQAPPDTARPRRREDRSGG